MSFKVKPVLLLTSLSFLSACGGGGGDSGPTFTAEAPIEITQAKSPELIAEGSAVASNTDGIGVDLGQRGDAPTSGQKFSFSSLVLGKVKKIQQRTQTALRTETGSCSEGGTMSFTLNDGATETSASGSMTFNSCAETPDETINGKVGFSLSKTSSGFSASLNFSNFTVDGSDFTFTGNGKVSMSYAEFSAYEQYIFNGSRFVYTVTQNGRSMTVGHLQETLLDYGSYESFNISFSANSSVLGGSFQFQTTQNLIEYSDDSYPSQGQFVITGAGNSKVRATSQGGTASSNVLIETDEDGDGAYEGSTTMTWQEIEEAASSLL